MHPPQDNSTRKAVVYLHFFMSICANVIAAEWLINMNQINFSSNNFIKSYQYYAFPLGVLSDNQLFYNDWLLGRFIQLFYGSNLQFDEQYYSEWEITEHLLYENLMHENDLKSFIQQHVSDGYAIHFWNLNEKYIPDTYAYNNFDFLHDLLVIGYDENGYIKIVNYNKSRHLSIRSILLECLSDSLTRYTNARIFKFKTDNSITYNPQQIINALYQYVKPNKINGLNYYNDKINLKGDVMVGTYAVQKFIDDIKNNIYAQDYTHSFCLLFEHKQVINFNLEYLCKQKILDQTILQEYQKVLKVSKLLISLYLKFKLNPNQKLKISIEDKLDYILKNETNILLNLTKTNL